MTTKKIKCTCPGEGDGVNGSGYHYDDCPIVKTTTEPDPFQGAMMPEKPWLED